jgi:RimJ/RimL family protein N-acetyltransferase
MALHQHVHSADARPVVLTGPLLFGADRAVMQWVARRLDRVEWGDSYAAIGVVDSSRSQLIAGVVFHGFDGTNMMQSAAAETPSWCRPAVLRGLFYYPFITAGCRRLTCLIASSNARSLRLNEGIGFVREGVLREHAEDGGDSIVLGMLRRECRFLTAEERHG